MSLSRRDFLKKCGEMSALIFGCEVFGSSIAHGFLKLATENKPQVVFMQGQCCTGCSVSTTYGNEIDFVDFITNIIRLQIHPTLSFNQGKSYIHKLNEFAEKEKYVLVFEGTIPEKIKQACMIDEVPIYDFAKKIISKAQAVITSGTCACFGGIPASNQNVTGAIPIDVYMKKVGISKPTIKIPGCPINPDRLMGTVAYLVATGKLPQLNKDGAPIKYYNDLIHNQCSRYQFFNQEKYSDDLSKNFTHCLLKVGCRGPVTESDCPTRRWNGKTSVCIESNAPCIGCIHKKFPFNSPLYISPNEIDEKRWSDVKMMLSK